MSNSQHRLFWCNQIIGTISDVGWSDFPWVSGNFLSNTIDSEIRNLLEWFDIESKKDDGISVDPPFREELLNGWSIEKPDGTKTELIMPPIIDFASGIIEWR